jgi:SAM-dependent methyltransferase
MTAQTMPFAATQAKYVLHVGCGVASPAKLPEAFHGGGWEEIRLDIDPNVNPHIVATITDMKSVPNDSVDAVYSSHNLEHLYPHEVPLALREFRRVLKPDGFVLVTLPDLQSVARLVADGLLEESAYISPAGPIAPHDILYGLRPALAQGNLFMAHRTGFTGRTLSESLLEAGFFATLVQRIPDTFALWAIGFCDVQTEQQFRDAQERFLPVKEVLSPMEMHAQ